MGGMCLGSLLLPRYVGARHHPLRVYAFLELGIGLFGVIVLYGVPVIGGLYTEWAGTGTASLVLRALVASICLLPPTLLMGATLPVVARGVEATPNGVSWLGYFYGGNLAGAVAGSLLAGFYLLRLYDMPTATMVAVALNVLVAVIALAVARVMGHHPAPAVMPARRETGVSLVYVAIALSGMTALGAEVIWTRQLSLLFGATTYTFSLILAVFLTGLGIGSSMGSGLAKRFPLSRAALGVCQLLLCAAIAWAAHATGASLPYWPIILRSEKPGLPVRSRSASCAVGDAARRDAVGTSFPLQSAPRHEGQDRPVLSAVSTPPIPSAPRRALVTSLVLVAAVAARSLSRS